LPCTLGGRKKEKGRQRVGAGERARKTNRKISSERIEQKIGGASSERKRGGGHVKQYRRRKGGIIKSIGGRRRREPKSSVEGTKAINRKFRSVQSEVWPVGRVLAGSRWRRRISIAKVHVVGPQRRGGGALARTEYTRKKTVPLSTKY